MKAVYSHVRMALVCLFLSTGCRTPTPTRTLVKQLERELGSEWAVIQHENRISVLSSSYFIWSWDEEIEIDASRNPMRQFHYEPMRVDLIVHEYIPEMEYASTREQRQHQLEVKRQELLERGAPSYKNIPMPPHTQELTPLYEEYHDLRLKLLKFPTHQNGTVSVHADQVHGTAAKTLVTFEQVRKASQEAGLDCALPVESGMQKPASAIGVQDPHQVMDDFWRTFGKLFTPYPPWEPLETAVEDE